MDSSGVVKEQRSKGDAAFVAEACDKARAWRNQSGNSEAAKIKSVWFEADKKSSCGGGVPLESPRRSACLLPLPLCKPLALTVVRRCLVLLRRPARETSQSDENEYYNTENITGARGSFVTGLPPPPSSSYYAP